MNNAQQTAEKAQLVAGTHQDYDYRNAFKAWVYAKPNDLELFDGVKTSLLADGLCEWAELRSGVLSPTDMFLGLIRFYQAHSDLPLTVVHQPRGPKGKTVTIGLNHDEADEWIKVRDALSARMASMTKPSKRGSKAVAVNECKLMTAILSLADFYLKHRKILAPQDV